MKSMDSTDTVTVNVKKVMLIGNTGWVGHYCVRYLKETYPHLNIVGSHNSHAPNTTRSIEFSHECPQALFAEIERETPDVFINLSRGEDEPAYSNHKKLIQLFNTTDTHYAFCSSSNAVDAILNKPHTETEKGNAQSEYGKFKARCEDVLIQASKSFSIFRFSATHGYAPNRESRTTEFLAKLAAGEKVKVYRGVVQNRLFVGDLAKLIVDLAIAKKQGIYHLGTQDSSEEKDFLEKLAERFGYSRSQIEEGEFNECNLTVVPDRIKQEINAEYFENDTITKVADQEELSRFMATRTL